MPSNKATASASKSLTSDVCALSGDPGFAGVFRYAEPNFVPARARKRASGGLLFAGRCPATPCQGLSPNGVNLSLIGRQGAKTPR